MQKYNLLINFSDMKLQVYLFSVSSRVPLGFVYLPLIFAGMAEKNARHGHNPSQEVIGGYVCIQVLKPLQGYGILARGAKAFYKRD